MGDAADMERIPVPRRTSIARERKPTRITVEYLKKYKNRPSYNRQLFAIVFGKIDFDAGKGSVDVYYYTKVISSQIS